MFAHLDLNLAARNAGFLRKLPQGGRLLGRDPGRGNPAAAFALRQRTRGPRPRPQLQGEPAMDDHVYKIIELASSSEESLEDAVHKGIARAAETLQNLRWFEVKEMRGHIENGKVAHFQVVLRIGFTLKGA
jgi:flavin-binding protein dodecin